LKKILFVPDVVYSNDSGARSASYTVKILTDMGYIVGIYTHDNSSNKFENISHYNRSHFRMKQHFFYSEIKREFKNVLNSFKPDFLFFAGGTINKPLIYYKFCIKNNIPFVFIDYCATYFCLKGFSGLSSGPCIKCINGNFLNALFNRCIDKKSRKYIYWLLGSIILYRFRKVLRHTRGAIGYGKSQLDTYNKLGIPKNKLYETSIFIDTKSIIKKELVVPFREDFFFIYGQQRVVKGWHLLKEIFERCSEIKFKIAIHDSAQEKLVINEWGLDKFILSKQLQIVTDLSWSELKENILKSKGIILPTYWQTTGEFSLIESLGLGKPVVAFNIGFHQDYLENKKNAMLADIGDIKTFSDNIIRLSSDNELCKKLANGASHTFNHVTSINRHKILFKNLFQ